MLVSSQKKYAPQMKGWPHADKDRYPSADQTHWQTEPVQCCSSATENYITEHLQAYEGSSLLVFVLTGIRANSMKHKR